MTRWATAFVDENNISGMTARIFTHKKERVGPAINEMRYSFLIVFQARCELMFATGAWWIQFAGFLIRQMVSPGSCFTRFYGMDKIFG
jgi:hypothetical protein